MQNYARLLYDYARDKTEYGSPMVRQQAEKETRSSKDVIDGVSFGDWTTKVQIASPAEKAMTPLMEEKVRFGIYAHALFASIRHAGDVVEAMERLSEQAGITEEERQRLSELAQMVVTHPDSRRFFDPAYGVKNECDLTDGGRTGRPDRVVFTSEETWVVDFKTGLDLAEQHDRQVRMYCRAIADMGYPRVSGWLIYLTPDLRVRQVAL